MDATICKAISNRCTLKMLKAGEPRLVIPIIYGIMTNGAVAVRCLKIVKGEPITSDHFRNYHASDLTHLECTGDVIEKVDVEYKDLFLNFQDIYCSRTIK